MIVLPLILSWQFSSSEMLLVAGQAPQAAKQKPGRQTTARAKRPIRLPGLTESLRINGLSTAELIREIERRGVDFELTDENEQALLAAGATPEIIEAVRLNYHGASVASGNENNTQPGDGAADDSSAAKQDAELPLDPAGTGYDEFFDQGTAALHNEQPDLALTHFTTAASLNPSDPRAFSMLGMTYLYWKQDIAAAERHMQRAIGLGGSAVLRVAHDHDGFFTSVCFGSLFISPQDVTFRADDGRHTFAATRDSIREFKLNAFVGSEYGAFHIKVRTGQNQTKNFNFAPRTQQRSESELAIRLYNAAGMTRLPPPQGLASENRVW
ncbi:hypothetical protein [Chloracidobacterium thermophilum]|uniref:hypothetical protein n=1 Tax=Chloracidobacterium thermophilum TaxID=458033 RepID=UPI0007387E9C|nr:hypothetical protein [Chloracidobacterium thermophilum]